MNRSLPTFTANKKSGLYYIKLRSEKVANTKCVSACPVILVDYDKKGNTLGIEILDVSRNVFKKIRKK